MEARPARRHVEDRPPYVRWTLPHPGRAAQLLQRGRLVRCDPDGVHELPVQPGQQPPSANAGRPEPRGLLQPVIHEREPAQPHPFEQRHEQLEEHGLLWPDGVPA